LSTLDAKSGSPVATSGAEATATPTVLRPEQANVVVLATDPALLEHIRSAIDGRHRFWRAESATHAAELVLASNRGVLLIDAAVTGHGTAEIVTRIRQQLPELPVVVTGRRDDEAELASLISSGDVYRFLHKPVSQERARTFIDGAVRRQQVTAEAATYGSRPGPGPEPPVPGEAVAAHPRDPGGSRRLLIPGALIAATLIGAVAWLTLKAAAPERSEASTHAAARDRDAVTVNAAPDPRLAEAEAALDAGRLAEPRGNNAIELFRQVLRRNPGNDAARRGLVATGNALLDRSEQALVIGDLLAAATMLDAARFAEPPPERLRALREKLDAARAGINARPPAGTIHTLDPASVPQTGQQEARTLLGRAMQRMAAGNLVDGPQSAVALLRSARQANPTDPAIAAAQDRLSDLLVLRAREALAAGRYSDAVRWTAEVEGLARDPGTAASLRAEIARGQSAASGEEHQRLLALANRRIAEGHLIEPTADSAQHYVDLLRAADGDFPGLSDTIQALSRRLLDGAREQLRRQQWREAEYSLRAAGALGIDLPAVRRATDVMERVRQAYDSPPLTAESELNKSRHVAAAYPARAARLGVEGSVELEFTIGTDGNARDMRILASSPAGTFDAAATEAVGQWRYAPLDVDGIAIPARTRVRLRFRQPDR